METNVMGIVRTIDDLDTWEDGYPVETDLTDMC